MPTKNKHRKRSQVVKSKEKKHRDQEIAVCLNADQKIFESALFKNGKLSEIQKNPESHQ